MTDIDSLFKKPSIPSASNLSKKRKLEPTRNALEAYKSARVEINKGKGKAAAVEDGDGLDDSDMDAGPALPGEQEFDEDDEEGRFFGGGVSKPTLEILDYMDAQDGKEGGGGAALEKIDVAWLRKMALNFEKKISKNAELRGKFEDEPQKFMTSEAELDEALKSLSILSEHPELFEDFASLGCAASLAGLLAHENTDIASDAVEIISELTDDEVEAEVEQWNALVNSMVEAQLLELLTSNLSRLNESLESDRAGVYHTLTVFENLTSQRTLSELIVSSTTLLSWLLSRLQVRESPVTQNKQYSAELLSILLQSSPLNRHHLLITIPTSLDTLLQLLSPYRKRDPMKTNTEEEEFMENLFDCATCLVHDALGKQAFVDAEGVELVLIMLREGKKSKPRALRLLDHAVSGGGGGAGGGGGGVETSTVVGGAGGRALVCEKLVEAIGLKTIFGLFMKKKHDHPQITEHLLGILSALLTSLPAESPARIRTLAKFVEKEYEKIEKLLVLRSIYLNGVKAVDKAIEKEKGEIDDKEEWEEMEGEWLMRRLDGGLFCLQLVDLILAWLCAEDDGARERIKDELEKVGLGLDSVRGTLMEQLEGLGGIESEEGEREEGEQEEDDGEDEETRNTKEMLRTLIKFL